MAAADPQRFPLLYQDELTYYRRPTVACGYAPVGDDGPRADQGHRSNSKRRVIGALEARTGRLICRQRAHADHATLIRYYRELEAAYPRATTIFLAQDNWPVHRHPEVLAALDGTRIHLLWLPTYAPWTNPIEKVWRRLYAEVLHLHEFRDQWAQVVAAVTRWLDRWSGPSPELLRYVGLHPD
jgi:putative transposase